MAPAKSPATTAVKVALLAAVFVLCIAGFGSCQSSGFECTDGNFEGGTTEFLPLTTLCQTVCEPGEFLDPLTGPLSAAGPDLAGARFGSQQSKFGSFKGALKSAVKKLPDCEDGSSQFDSPEEVKLFSNNLLPCLSHISSPSLSLSFHCCAQSIAAGWLISF